MSRSAWIALLVPLTVSAQQATVSGWSFDAGWGTSRGPALCVVSAVGQDFATPAFTRTNRVYPGILARALLPGPALSVPVDEGVPAAFSLSQNYPNPFNGQTRIGYRIPESGAGKWVRLKVYDILGREVTTLAEGAMEAGEHTVTFDADGLATGPYIYRIVAGSYAATKTMILLK
jgi:hypothetical protein